MMKLIFGLLFLSLFIAGCSHSAQESTGDSSQPNFQVPIPGSQVDEAIVEDETAATEDESAITDDTPSQEEPEEKIISETHMVDIVNFDFMTKELKISVGDTVVWTNRDSVKHTVTSDSGDEMDSKLLGQNEAYSYTFTKAGTYAYHCRPHPYMKAKIIVE